ncbi:uncharacterized protein LOC113513694 [Galleria mellonella]|uniref:Uncharacterized protein LOC113513694 n=1 Tax=Galleria mellonella TaxID=7137 RepID=A0A6J1WNW5_GALME|nr:uncharacterized protein LOC113513694 [Galleria mellonella]
MLTYDMLAVIFLINIVNADIYTVENATRLFNFFKTKYNKMYKNKLEEKNSLRNFIDNLNKVAALNEKVKGNDTLYVINRYADMDPEDFDQHYAISLKTYENEGKVDLTNIGGQDILRNTMEKIRNKVEKDEDYSESIELYDLGNANNLYKQYMEKFGKKNATKKYDRTVHFYRFVKTLVDINRNHFKGNYTIALDDNADIVKEPYEYFY